MYNSNTTDAKLTADLTYSITLLHILLSVTAHLFSMMQAAQFFSNTVEVASKSMSALSLEVRQSLPSLFGASEVCLVETQSTIGNENEIKIEKMRNSPHIVAKFDVRYVESRSKDRFSRLDTDSNTRKGRHRDIPINALDGDITMGTRS